MKRSEYIAQRRAHWSARWNYKETDLSIERLAQADVEAAEAAGVGWDKEEPELPARLRLDDRVTSGLIATVAEPSGGPHVAELRNLPSDPYRDYRLTVLRAMVDAYNDWGPQGRRRKELWKLIDADLDEHKLRRFVGNVLTEPWGEEEGL